MPIATVDTDVRHIVGDVTWAVWRVLVAHPPYSTTPPEVFVQLRQAVDGVLVDQWQRGGMALVLSPDRWGPELADRVAEVMERPSGGMARGPLEVLVADAIRSALAPTTTVVGRSSIWRLSSAA